MNIIVDIPTQFLLTILLSTDQSLKSSLKIYLIAYTKKETIYNKLIFSQNWYGNES